MNRNLNSQNLKPIIKKKKKAIAYSNNVVCMNCFILATWPSYSTLSGVLLWGCVSRWDSKLTLFLAGVLTQRAGPWPPLLADFCPRLLGWPVDGCLIAFLGRTQEHTSVFEHIKANMQHTKAWIPASLQMSLSRKPWDIIVFIFALFSYYSSERGY